MSVADLLGKVVDGDTPWPLFLALVLFVGVLELARRLFGSLRRFGSRLGTVEAALRLEVTRRRQVEAALEDDGLRLPYWPPDGDGPRPRGHRYTAPEPAQLADAVHPAPPTGAEPTIFRPSVPAPPVTRR